MKRRITGVQLELFESRKITAEHTDLRKKSDGTRTLKIQYGHYPDSYKRHPVIRLAGCWLSNYDFQIGDSVILQMEKGQIHISKADSKKD